MGFIWKGGSDKGVVNSIFSYRNGSIKPGDDVEDDETIFVDMEDSDFRQYFMCVKIVDWYVWERRL